MRADLAGTGVTVAFDVPAASEFVLALDPAPAARDPVEAWVRNFLGAYRGRVRALFFFGDRVRRDPLRFDTDSPHWFAHCQRRVRLLAPVIEAAGEYPTETIVVVAGAPLHDFDDFKGDPVSDRMVLVNPSETRVQDVAERAEDRLVAVRIEGKGFLPLRFCRPQRGLDFQCRANDQGDWFLSASAGAVTRIECTLVAECTGLPVLVLERANGRHDRREGHPVPDPPSQDRWERIAEGHVPRLKEAARNGAYRCPHCRRDHAADLWVCPRSANVFPGMPLNAPILLKLGDEPPWFRALQADEFAVLCGPSTAITRDGAIVRKEGDAWRIERRLSGIQDLGDGLHGVLPRAG